MSAFYSLYRQLVGVCFNLLNLLLGGNLPPLGSACAIVEQDNKFLVIERPGTSKLVFPGGFMRWKELPAQTMLREAKEETGLTLQVGELIGCYSSVSRSIIHMSTLALVYQASIAGGTLIDSIEGHAAWHDQETLLRRLIYQQRSMFKDYLDFRARQRKVSLPENASEVV